MLKCNTLSKTHTVFLLAIISCLLWGSAFPSIKTGYTLFHIDSSSSQILFAGLRFTLAGIFTIIIGSVATKRLLLPTKSSLKSIPLLSLFQTIFQYIFFYLGLANTTGVKSSIINSSSVFFVILFSCFVFKMEKLTLHKLFGVIIGFAGVLLINLSGKNFDMSFTWTGDGFIIICSAAAAISSILMKKFSVNENPVMLSGYQFIFGGIIMTAIALLMGGILPVINFKGIAIIIYLALVSAVAYSIWSLLLKYNPASKVAVFGFFTPIFGVLLSALILKESNSFGIIGIISLALVCAGIFTVNSEHKL